MQRLQYIKYLRQSQIHFLRPYARTFILSADKVWAAERHFSCKQQPCTCISNIECHWRHSLNNCRPKCLQAWELLPGAEMRTPSSGPPLPRGDACHTALAHCLCRSKPGWLPAFLPGWMSLTTATACSRRWPPSQESQGTDNLLSQQTPGKQGFLGAVQWPGLRQEGQMCMLGYTHQVHYQDRQDFELVPCMHC